MGIGDTGGTIFPEFAEQRDLALPGDAGNPQSAARGEFNLTKQSREDSCHCRLRNKRILSTVYWR
jgi:hypothetical protein